MIRLKRHNANLESTCNLENTTNAVISNESAETLPVSTESLPVIGDTANDNGMDILVDILAFQNNIKISADELKSKIDIFAPLIYQFLNNVSGQYTKNNFIYAYNEIWQRNEQLFYEIDDTVILINYQELLTFALQRFFITHNIKGIDRGTLQIPNDIDAIEKDFQKLVSLINKGLSVDTAKIILANGFAIHNDTRINVTSHSATKQTILNNKIALLLPDIVCDGDVTIIENRNGVCSVKCAIDFKDTIYDGQHITYEERDILNAVISLYVANVQHVFTVPQITRAWLGIPNSSRLSPTEEQQKIVIDAMNKFRIGSATIDLQNHPKFKRAKEKNEYPGIEKLGMKTYILNTSVIAARAGGNDIKAYKINERPIMLCAAEITKEIISVESDLLDIKKIKNGKLTDTSYSHNRQRAAITRALIARIKTMKNKKNTMNNNCIRLEYSTNDRTDRRNMVGLYQKVGYADPPELPAGAPAADVSKRNTNIKKQKYEIRKFIETVLDNYVLTGEIEGYERYPANSQTIEGYKININQQS